MITEQKVIHLLSSMDLDNATTVVAVFEALLDIMDGTDPSDIQFITGLSEERCNEINEIVKVLRKINEM